MSFIPVKQFTDEDLMWLLEHGAVQGRFGCFEIRLKGATFRTFHETLAKKTHCGAYIGISNVFFGYGDTAEEAVKNAVVKYEEAMEQGKVRDTNRQSQERILSEIKEIVNYKADDDED